MLFLIALRVSAPVPAPSCELDPGVYYLSQGGMIKAFEVTTDCKVLHGPVVPIGVLQDEYHRVRGTMYRA